MRMSTPYIPKLLVLNTFLRTVKHTITARIP